MNMLGVDNMKKDNKDYVIPFMFAVFLLIIAFIFCYNGMIAFK